LDRIREEKSALQRQVDDTTRESNEIAARLMDEIEKREREISEMKSRVGVETDADPESRPDEVYDLIRFRSGREIICRVVAYEDDVFQITLPNGEVRKTWAKDVESIRIRSGPGEAHTTAEPDPSLTPPGPKAPGKAPQQSALAISAFWNVKIPASSLKIKDFQTILAKYGTPRKDLAAHPDIEVYKGIAYLTPLRAAEEVLNVKLADVKPIDFGPYPKKCFRYHQYKGNFEAGYNRLNIVTDAQDQVVAVQVVETDPEQYDEFPSTANWSDLHRPPRSVGWHLVNLVDGRHKGSSRATVRFGTGRPRSGIVGIACEFRTSRNEVVERSILYLAQPVVDLILLTIRDVY
jgi:hypothetical protein